MRRKRGQVLILVLVVMVLGLMLMVPLIAYVGSSLQLTSIWEGNIDAYYAAEAGVEAVLTDIYKGKDPLSVAYPPEGSLLRDGDGGDYSLNESVNGYDVNIAIALPDNPLLTGKEKYDFGNALPGSKAWYVDSDNVPPETYPNSKTELTGEQYVQISNSDDQRYTSPDPGGWWYYDDYASIKCDFALGAGIDSESATEIKMLWEGYPATSSEVTLWVWNINTESWNNKATVYCPSGADTTIEVIISTDIADYVSGDGHLIFCAQNREGSERITTDYIKIEIAYEQQTGLYLDPGVVFWLQNIPPDGGTANCTYDFTLVSEPNTVKINWVLAPNNVAQYANWKISVEKDGVLVDPPGEMTGSGQPDSFLTPDLSAGNYTAHFWVQNNHSSKTLYTMPFSNSKAGSPDYTWLKIGSSSQMYVINSTAIDQDGNMATITTFAYRSPGPEGWWKKQHIEISTWLIE